MPKLDEVASLHSIYHPDVICTVLSSDVSNSELFIPNYNIIRHDCNCHGGGVSSIPSGIHVSSPIEFLLISLVVNHRSLTISTFYHPPSSPSDLDLLFDTLTQTRLSLLHNFILVGDFNVNYTINSPLLDKLHAISDS